MKFSVIIPVYNVASYLPECLDSILAQSCADFEVLLINDGSTDASGLICDHYANRDDRFMVFHQDNKGVSAARNVGLAHAKGEWISFIDSDDLVEPEFLKAFLKNITGDTDMIIQGIKRIGKVNDVFCAFEASRKINAKTFFQKYLIWPYYFSPCNKIYRRSLVIKYHLHFDEAITYGEDTLFNLDYALHAQSLFTLLPDVNYIYRFNFEGLATKEVGFYKRWDLLVSIHEKLNKITPNRSNLYPYCIEVLRTLYTDETVAKTYAPLKKFIRTYKPEVLQIYESNILSVKTIAFLIKNNQYFLLDLIFKFLNRKENKI